MIAIFALNELYPGARFTSPGWQLLGGAVIVLGLALLVIAGGLFKQADTDLIPFREVTALVTTGGLSLYPQSHVPRYDRCPSRHRCHRRRCRRTRHSPAVRGNRRIPLYPSGGSDAEGAVSAGVSRLLPARPAAGYRPGASEVDMNLRTLGMLLLACQLAAACATTETEPSADYRARVETASDGPITVSVSALSSVESVEVYGRPLAVYGIQPVWIEVENRDSKPYWFLPQGLDPNYFPYWEAAEAFTLGENKWFDDAERERFPRVEPAADNSRGVPPLPASCSPTWTRASSLSTRIFCVAVAFATPH